jgi:Zn-dependent peptidase ImmA (M78 family)/transcriptional regulator with XRE-family HTH domain
MFTPSRLALARRRRGLTKRALAELVGVTDRSITGYESGEMDPDPLTLERIAEALRFPSSFFTAVELEEVPTDATSFRSLARMTASQRHAAQAAGTLALALNDWIDSKFRLPEPTVPKLGPGIDPETAAEVVRAEWQLGEQPIPNVIHLLESHGVRVFSLAEECREVDAYSFWRSGQPFIFLNTKKSAEHSRLDAAHELGHLVLHWHHEGTQGKEAERDAQRFGSAFLMPRAAIMATAQRSPSLATLMGPKRHWRVSLAAYVYRLYKLGLLTEWHYRTLIVELSKRGYRTNEPHPIQRETSQVLNKVFNALRKQGIGKAEVARTLHVYPSDLDALIFGLAILPVAGSGSGASESTAQRPTLRVLKGEAG